MIIIIVFWHYGWKNNKKKEKCVVECCTDSTRDVVFFKESTNLSDGPFHSSHWQMGIKQPANQSAVDVKMTGISLMPAHKEDLKNSKR